MASARLKAVPHELVLLGLIPYLVLKSSEKSEWGKGCSKYNMLPNRNVHKVS